MKIYIVGSRGRLGGALLREFSGEHVVNLKREEYSAWSTSDAALGASLVHNFFQKKIVDKSIVIICSGLINPNLDSRDVIDVNYNLPVNIIQGVHDLGLRVVTIGTILEISNLRNNYINSKIKLSKYISSVPQNKQILHIRLHTLYGGGPPPATMFLGQIYESLKNNKTFKMTSGEQLREYHDVDDVAKAINALIKSGIYGLVDLSHGNPIKLFELASKIFSYFNKNDLLKVSVFQDDVNENFKATFQKNRIFENNKNYGDIESILNYLESTI